MKMDSHPYKILIVEDNPGDYVLVEDYLHEQMQRPELTHCSRFRDALKILNDGEADLDLIMLDLSLPDVSKEELIKSSKEFNQLPVIILTGYSDMDFAVNSLSQGVSDYLIKDMITPLILYKSVIYSIERHRFLQSLIASEKRYMDLFHLSPAPMWVYNLETLEFLDVNKAAVNNYGYTREQFMSMTLKDIRPSEDIQYLEKAVEQSRGKHNFYFKDVFRHRKKNGAIIHVEITSNIIHFQGINAEIVQATDITEKILQLNAIAEQNEKLREIAWTQSHVVRAPVARLMGLIDLIKSGRLNDKEQLEFLNQITESAKEIDAVIRDITDKSQAIQPDQ